MRSRLLLILLSATVIAGPALAADKAVEEKFEAAVKLLETDPAAARRQFEDLAKSGEPEALNALALMTETGGGGGKPDEAAALAMFEKAVAVGSETAKLNLGLRYAQSGDPAKQARAATLLTEAAQNDKLAPLTYYPVGRMALLGIGRPAEQAMGVKLLEASLKVDPKNGDALFLVARAYQNGWGGVTRDQAKSVGLFDRALDAGDIRAARQLGMAYLSGQGAPEDGKKAFDYFMKGAQGGHADAMIDVAVMLATGEAGVKVDGPAARDWYRKAAESGSAHAARGLGGMLINAEGGPANVVQGWGLVELAAGGGDSSARQMLAAEPREVDRDGIDAFKRQWIAAHGALH